MRLLVLAGWLLLLPAALAYHMGPGQAQAALDSTSNSLAAAEALAGKQEYAKAVDQFDAALKTLPADRPADNRRIRIERAKAQLLGQKLTDAHADMTTLVDELQADEKADPKQLADARAVLANAQYYMTWLMRLEGLGRDEWEPEIEAARQTFKHLAETTADPAAKAEHTKDLEAAVRLARMELGELQGLALPCQCQGCKSCNSKKTGKTSKKKPEKQDIRSAGSGSVPETGGR